MSTTHGMNWIWPPTRLAIYLRDGLACAWCGIGLEEGVVLTLAHIVPRSQDGTNQATNLITACKRCNDVRKDRHYRAFAKDVAQYINDEASAAMILAHITRIRRRKVPLEQAKALMKQRGNFSTTLRSLANEK